MNGSHALAPLLAALLVAGCANAMPGASPTPVKPQPADTAGTFQRAGTYQMSEAELALDCKKLTGRIQLRLLQLRDAANRPTTSQVARSTQAIVKPVLGGSAYGIDPKQQTGNDRAIVQAYNEDLKRKNCPAFDLDAELASTDSRHTPRPVMPK